MQPKRYDPVGRCIYCGKTAEDAGMKRLQEEHIVSYSLGGTWVLPEASCATCGAKTGADEGNCAGQMLVTARTHFHWKSRKSKRPQKLKVGQVLGYNGKWWDVSLDEHPPFIQLPSFFPPGVLMNTRPDGAGMMITGTNMYTSPTFMERLNALGPGGAVFSNLEVGAFCRMLAKIAHAYTTAELGMGNFEPFLPDIVLEKVPYISHVVGSAFGTGTAASDLHELALSKRGQLIICNVRLYGRYGLSSYLVVSGRM